MDTRKYIAAIKEKGITGDIVSEIINAHKKDHDRMINLYNRYRVDKNGPAIFNRSAIEYTPLNGSGVLRLDDKVNNQLNNAFDADIVDTKIGYMFGHPISYNVDKKNEAWETEVKNFLLRNNVEDIDAEWGKIATICGYAGRLTYIDKEGQLRIENIDPWEVVFLGKDITEPEYSLRYYSIDNIEYAEFYDETYVYFFSSEKGKYTMMEQKPHLFDYNPLFGVPNNKELKGDAEKVLSLIDAYDRTLSDVSNEIEQYRLAYLILRGMGLDDDQIEELKKTGVFQLFDEKDDVKYLTKDINDALIEHHLDRLEENILRFAKSVNFSDEQFAGNISGVAMKFKIMALENKCIVMERKMTAALRYQFKLLCSAWAKKGICSKEDYLKVWFSFKRNLPVNLLDEAQTTAALRGHVSEKTRLSLLSFVDDVDYEIEEMRKEEEEMNLEPLGGVEEDEPTGD